MPNQTTPIERADTGLRLLFSVLLMLITEVVQIILGFVTAFSLAFALVTQKPPSEQVRRFANRTLSYLYQIFRYLTYNAAELPFPFADFPTEVEPIPPAQSLRPKPGDDSDGPANGPSDVPHDTNLPV